MFATRTTTYRPDLLPIVGNIIAGTIAAVAAVAILKLFAGEHVAIVSLAAAFAAGLLAAAAGNLRAVIDATTYTY